MTHMDSNDTFDERFGPERLAEVAAARDRGDLDYLDFVSGRWARFTELKERRDLVQLHDVAEWLSLGPHPVAYDDVLAQFVLSARHGEFGTIGPRRKVKGLLYLEPYSAPRGKRRLRLTSLEIETLKCVRYLWGSRSMLAQWLENRGWPVAPWLATAPSTGSTGGPPKPPSGVRTTSAEKAENACREWITALFEQWRAGTATPTKSAAFEGARTAVNHIGALSGKAFERAWHEEAPAEWKHPGRRRKQK